MNPTINLNANTFDLLWHLARATKWKTQLASCNLRHRARAANREAQLDSCELRHLAHAANKEVQLDLYLLYPRFEKAFDVQSTDATTN